MNAINLWLLNTTAACFVVLYRPENTPTIEIFLNILNPSINFRIAIAIGRVWEPETARQLGFESMCIMVWPA